MLEQHSTHVFSLSSSPHRRHSHAAAPPTRSILKKPSSAPTSPCSSSPPSTPWPSMSSSNTGYQSQQWSVAGIARAESSSSTTRAGAGTRLTITLLYTPTDTLLAWPFNLASPGAKGVCYETLYCDKQTGAVRTPPEGTMSTSLRVLADVIRCWIRIRRERSMARAEVAEGAWASTSSTASSPTSSIDALVDNDEVVDQIIEHLGLAPLTPFERSIHLLRQVLPEPSAEESTSPPPSDVASEMASDDDRDSRHRSDSSASSRASTLDTVPDDVAPSRKASPARLPKLTTSLAGLRSPPKVDVPQIKLVEATPQEAEYEERERILEREAHASRRKSHTGGMDTLHEDEAERSNGNEEGDVTSIEVVAVDPPSAQSTRIAKPQGEVSFRDPFKNVQGSSIDSAPERGETARSSKSPARFPKRPSFDSLRARFTARSKSQ